MRCALILLLTVGWLANSEARSVSHEIAAGHEADHGRVRVYMASNKSAVASRATSESAPTGRKEAFASTHRARTLPARQLKGSEREPVVVEAKPRVSAPDSVVPRSEHAEAHHGKGMGVRTHDKATKAASSMMLGGESSSTPRHRPERPVVLGQASPPPPDMPQAPSGGGGGGNWFSNLCGVVLLGAGAWAVAKYAGLCQVFHCL